MAQREPTSCLAAAQFEPVPGDVEQNLGRHLALVDLALTHAAELLVFPELSLTGYELDGFETRAMGPGDARLDPLRQAARRSAMTIVAGAPVRVEGRLHLASFVFLPDGGEALYTKQHLGAFTRADTGGRAVPPAEWSVAEPGALDPLIPVGAQRLALAICADTGRPDHAAGAARRGATIYGASVFAIPADIERDVARLEQRSAQHGLVVVMANFCGESGGLPAGGCSRIIAHGKTVVALGPRETGLALWGSDVAATVLA